MDHHWEFWRWRNYALFGCPIAINLMAFWYYSHIVLPALFEGDESFKDHRTVCLVIMNFTSAFFIINELPVIIRQPSKEYNAEKISGWVSAILIIYNSIKQDYTTQFFWAV